MARKHYRRWQPPDIYAYLGPGDPGYRLRPGRTGFDPMEMYAEYGRLIGLLLKAAMTGHVGPFPWQSLVVLGGLLLIFFPEALGGMAVLLVWITLRALFRSVRGLLS